MKKYFYFLSIVFFSGMMAITTTLTAQTIRYVTVAGNGSGSSWADASGDLQGMINASAVNDQVWVAKGTYYPTITTDRTISFAMKDGVKIYGSFAGIETAVTDRTSSVVAGNPSILSGDIDKNNTLDAGNSYIVISNNNLSAAAVLDGFTVSGGYNNYAGNGGGMSNVNASPSVNNCIFSANWAGNFGGGVFNSNSSPIINQCVFSGNFGGGNGGGLGNFQGSATITNCSFLGNSATNGGGLGNYQANATVTDCIFIGNAGNSGGGISNTISSSSSILNCTFSGNTSAVANQGDGAIGNMKNCILWGDNGEIINAYNGTATVTNSIVQGGYTGTGNISVDPQFVHQPPIGLGTVGDLRLQATSCAIENGNNSAVPPGITTDLAGNSRIYNNGVVDMGAYEYQGTKQAYVYVPPATTTNNALNFDGVDDYVSLSASNFSSCTSTPLAVTNAITVAYWFKGSNIQSAVRFQDGNGYIVAGWTGNGSVAAIHILSNDGGTATGIPVGATVTDGNWHYVAFTWQQGAASGFKSYLDGQLVAQRDAGNTALPAIINLSLGSNGGNSEFMNGSLDEVQVWNAALSQTAIQANMSGNITTPQTGMLMYYKFDHGVANGNNSGVTQLLNSANGNQYPGTLYNFSLTGTSSNWVLPGGYAAPQVTTASTSSITASTAQSGGNVTTSNGIAVTERGIVYSTTPHPTISNTKIISGSGTGTFTAGLTGLGANTTYYLRAYASNGAGTGYGSELTFTAAPACTSTYIAPAVNYATTKLPFGIATGDLNGDGIADMAIVNFNSNNSAVSVYLNHGDGTFAAAVNYTIAGRLSAVVIGDLNGDGKADLAVNNYGYGSVSILLNNGNGTFTAGGSYATGSGNIAMAIADINGDGKPDLAAVANAGLFVSVLLNNGNGSFAPAVNYPTGNVNPYAIALGDINGDGKADMAVANVASNNVSIYLNNGDGTFGPAINYQTPSSPIGVILTDLNGDGKTDMATGNTDDNSMSVFFNNGTGIFTTPINYATGQGPVSIATSDLNGDGRPDLVTANGSDNTYSVFFNKGDGTFSAAVNNPIGSYPYAVSGNDLNGDGIGDLAVINQNDNTVSVLLSKCNVATTTAISSSSNPSCQGSNVTFTATVLQAGSQTPVTSGGITFTQGNTVLADSIPVDATGKATLSTDTLIAGMHNIVATYKAVTGFTTSNKAINQVVNATPTASISGAATYCSGSNTATNLTITATGTAPFTGTLSGGIPFSSTVSPFIVTVAPTLTTTYTIAGFSDVNCTAQSSDLSGNATVTINPKPTVASINYQGNTSVCSGAIVSLTNATAGGLWSTSNNAAGVSSAGTVTFATVSASTPVTIYYTVTSNGCAAQASIVFTVNPPLSVKPITGNMLICGVNATTSLADNTSGGVWSSSNTAIATVSTNGIVTGKAVGQDTIYYTISSGGCLATVQTLVSVNTSPTVAAISGNSQVLKNCSITLTDATKGGTWSSSNVALATVTSAGVVKGVSAGTVTIYYTLTSGSCSVAAAKSINIYNPLTATTSAGSIGCYGGSTTLTVMASGGSGGYQYNINGGKFQTGNTFTVTAGAYLIVVTDQMANQFTLSGIIIAQPSPLAVKLVSATNASSSTSATGSFTVSASGGTPAYQYSKNGGVSYQSSGTFTGLLPGAYKVSVKDANSCIALNYLTVNVGYGKKSASSNTSETLTVDIAEMHSVPENGIITASLYPNPSQAGFNLKLESNTEQKVELRVMDMLGRQLYHTTGSANETYRFGANFIKGIYLAEIVYGTGTKTLKMIKQ